MAEVLVGLLAAGVGLLPTPVGGTQHLAGRGQRETAALAALLALGDELAISVPDSLGTDSMVSVNVLVTAGVGAVLGCRRALLRQRGETDPAAATRRRGRARNGIEELLNEISGRPTWDQEQVRGLLETHTGHQMIKGFRDFILRGNVIDLAVAVVIGAAFRALVRAFSDSFITPVINSVFSALGLSKDSIGGTIWPAGEQVINIRAMVDLPSRSVITGGGLLHSWFP